MPTSIELAKLRKNPFTMAPAANTDVWADYEGVRQALLDVITSCRNDQVGLSEVVVLHGEIGTGKSHALRYLHHYITETQANEFQSACVYLESTKMGAKTDFVAVYRRVFESLRKHIFATAKALDDALEEKAKQEGATKTQDIITKKKELWRTTADALAPKFPSLILLLQALVDDETVFAVLCGEKRDNLHAFQLTTPINSEFDATRCLSSYINLVTNPNRDVLSEAVYKGDRAFYLFIDEVELLQDFKSAEVLSINQGIRDLINGCPQSFCLIFGVSGDPRVLFTLFDRFVVRRFSRDPIEIQALDEVEATRFLKDVLRNYRTDPSDPDEYPFREAALRRIAEKTPERTAASLFRAARRVLEKAVLTHTLQPGGWIEVHDVDQFLV